MKPEPAKSASPVKKGLWIPWSFVGLFGVVIAVNAAMIWFAIDSWTGLEREDAYRFGLDYNETLEARAAQKELGWKIRFALDPETGALTLGVHDKDDRLLDADQATAFLRRPSDAADDFEQALEKVAKGVFSGAIAWPKAGAWDMRIVIENQEQSFEVVKRVIVP